MSSRKKYNHLTLAQRIQVIELLEEGVSMKQLASQFQVTFHTIYHIKKNAGKIREKLQNKDFVSDECKKLRDPVLNELDEKLYVWFLEQMTMGNTVNDEILLNKATQLRATFGGPSTFKCSRGWIWRFKKRRGIRLIKMAPGESKNVDEETAQHFSTTFGKFLTENNIHPDNVYNMDETGLMWKNLPQKVIANLTNKSVGEDDQVVVGFCANSTGTHKLLPLFVHRSIKHTSLNSSLDSFVVSKNHENSCVDRNVFEEWFEMHFKAEVQKHQLDNGCHGKVILLLDYCGNHILTTDKLDDAKFQIIYLPPNATSILQPMNQGTITEVKFKFRQKLVERVVECSPGLLEFYQQYDVKECINILNTSWTSVNKRNIRDSWNRVLREFKMNERQADCLLDQDSTKEDLEETSNSYETSSIAEMLQRHTGVEINEEDVDEWLTNCDAREQRSIVEEERKGQEVKKEEENVKVKKEEDKEENVAKALDIIVEWSKQFDFSVQTHAKILKDLFQQRRK